MTYRWRFHDLTETQILDKLTARMTSLGFKLKTEHVERRVARLDRAMHGDGEYTGSDERAHVAEDALMRVVLAAIGANCCADPSGCARAALKTWDISFSRWYA